MKKMNEQDVLVPADVPSESKKEYIKNFLALTHSTGRIMLFAGDQKIEHLNDDFYGAGISADDNDPEHLFRIASRSTIGVFASQFGLISKYGSAYPNVPYLVKLNSKSNLVKTEQAEPASAAMVDVEDVVRLKEYSRLNIMAVGYTVYLGSEFESEMIAEAGRIATQAHEHGLLTVFWMYPRGQAVKDEKDPHLIAGAAGVGACLGADFVKVNYPKAKDGKHAEAFKEAIAAAGKQTAVITAGGSSKAVKDFLQETWDQINIAGCRGNATGRNIHQKSEADAIKLCNALSAITLEGKDVAYALKVFEGKK